METGKYSKEQYHLVSERIRELYPTSFSAMSNNERRILEELALSFAHKFHQDDDLFDPVDFLNRCSPDYDIWPLGELWENES